MNRKQFITQALLFSGIGGLVMSGCEKGEASGSSLPDAKVLMQSDLRTELLLVGSTKHDAVKGIFVKRIAAENVPASFQSFSLSCTHSGCIVAPQVSGEFHCHCHGSKFNSDGAVLNGPAATPLIRYVIDVSGTLLTIKG